MKFDWGKGVQALAKSALILLCGGCPLFVLYLFASLGLTPLYVTKETIRDGSYPVASEFYAVTASQIGEAAPQETNAELAAFLDWILSEQGRTLIEKTGYVSLY